MWWHYPCWHWYYTTKPSNPRDPMCLRVLLGDSGINTQWPKISCVWESPGKTTCMGGTWRFIDCILTPTSRPVQWLCGVSERERNTVWTTFYLFTSTPYIFIYTQLYLYITFCRLIQAKPFTKQLGFSSIAEYLCVISNSLHNSIRPYSTSVY